MVSIRAPIEDIDTYVMRPGKDCVRNRIVSLTGLLLIFLAMDGSKSISAAISAFYQTGPLPSDSAFCQQRDKLMPEALHALLVDFRARLVLQLEVAPGDWPAETPRYEFHVVDGSSFAFEDDGKGKNGPWLRAGGKKRCCEGHCVASRNLRRRLFMDAEVQPAHEKDERWACRVLVNRHLRIPGRRVVFIMDRGFSSWNTMAHTVESGAFFLMRRKDFKEGGPRARLDLPEAEGGFDVWRDVVVARSGSAALAQVEKGSVLGLVPSNGTFDYTAAGTDETCSMRVTCARFRLPNGTWESVVASLPDADFSTTDLCSLYSLRWAARCRFC